MKNKLLALTMAATLISAGLNTASATTLSNAEVSQISATNDLLSTVKSTAQSDQQWFKYQVKMAPTNGMPCCYQRNDDKTASCNIDKRSNGWSHSNQDVSHSKTLDIYFKWQNAAAQDLFYVGSECPVDGNGHKIIDIQNVDQQKSIEFLSGFVDADQDHSWERFIAAIALHQGNVAQNKLESFATNRVEDIRHQAIFWLGEARHEAGYQPLVDIVDNYSADIDDRTKAIFALSINRHDKSAAKLVELGKYSKTARIQSKALFWLAQSDSPQALDVLNYVLGSTARLSVKEKAVFAMSQLPNEQSTPALVNVLKSKHNKTLKKKALFWLGQSNDPLALEFIEGVLTTKSN